MELGAAAASDEVGPVSVERAELGGQNPMSINSSMQL